MGISCSCPLSGYNDLENGFESLTVKSINFGNDEEKTPSRSVSFTGRDPGLTISRSIGSGNMLLEVSVSFRTRERCLLDINAEGPSGSMEDNETVNQLCGSDCTTDQLADSTVLVEQSWRNLLDLVELNYNSVSFFDLLKKETAISRWSRAGKRAAKVGKGLSKNEKGQKLVLEHWLEAIDVQHRYGHNLRLYFIEWFHSSTMEPFFYWLDRGEGKNLNLVEKCSRSKLQQQCIKYLDPMERKAYEVIVEDGTLFYKQSREIIDTTREPKGVKWIFVLSTSKAFFIGLKRKGAFHHSSFLAGGATSAAGRIAVEKGIIKAVSPHSGHYRPTEENFQDFLSYLRENNVNVTEIKNWVDEEEPLGPKGGHFLRNNSFDNFPDDILVIEDVELEYSTVEKVVAASAELSSPGSSQNSINIQTRRGDDLLDRILCRDQ
ncbi:calmodulin-binding family protein [Forsythia ovata]|uniref:Calmodulin-binding family protein n=1 Tax=Forsythia ovata TaxID=205694 RepID=A0ABD1RIQ4_9LAMI